MRQPVIAYVAVIALDLGVLLRLSRLDERDLDAVLGGPSLGRLADVFRTGVAPDQARLSLGVATMLAVKHFFEGDEEGSGTSSSNSSGLVTAMVIVVALDGSLIGLGFAAKQKQGVLLTIAMTLEVFFLGLACSSTLAANGASRTRILVVPVVVGVLLLAGAGLGAAALNVMAAQAVDALLAFGVAALLFLVTEELLVEAHEVKETPFQTAMFFVGFIALFLVDMLL